MARGATVTQLKPSDYDEREFEVRGATYKIRELSAEEYDDCMAKSAKPDDDMDMVLLLKLMSLKSLIDPKLSADEWGKLPYRVMTRIKSEVNDLHFRAEEGK